MFDIRSPSPYGATTALDASDALPIPTEFVAVTVKVYEVLVVSPLTVAKVPLVVAVMPPGEEVTVYKLIGFPPELNGAVQTTTAVPLALPTVAITAVGFPGAAVVVVGGQSKDTVVFMVDPWAKNCQVANVPTCTGEERWTASPRPAAPWVLYPQVHKVPSVLRAAVRLFPAETCAQVESVPTCTGEEREVDAPAPRSPRPS